MNKIVVTGFQPFGEEAINPSYEAVRQLPPRIEKTQIVPVELPTVFGKSADTLHQAMLEHRPNFVLCIGQAGGRYGFTPERVAINMDDSEQPDNDGNLPCDKSICSGGPAAYFSTLPVKLMVENIKRSNIPAAVSNSAGTYVCNHVMYSLLHLIHTEPAFNDVKGGFLHIPYCTSQIISKPNTPSLSMEQIIRGVDICIRTIIDDA